MGDHYELSQELRDSLAKRLTVLDRREDYYLDLAAEEGWPKDRLRARIQVIRNERQDITRSQEQAEHQLTVGQQLFLAALNLLDDPQAMYRRGNEAVRIILNKALFGRLYVDGRKITGQEYQEPFDALMEAYDVWHQAAQTALAPPWRD